MSIFQQYFNSSIGKKQIVAVTGLVLILFVIGHLAGNLFIYGGPGVFNGYSKKMAGLRPALYLVETVLFIIFVVHLYVTALLVWENIQARGKGYAVYKSVGKRSWATRLMPYTGTVVLAFVIWHLLDFTFVDHGGPRSFMPDGSQLGLYAIVYNSFSNPLHSVLYILAMAAVGFHLAHGIQSFFQTFGFNHPRYTPVIREVSNVLATLITLAYSSIPVYVLLDNCHGKILFLSSF